RADQHRERHHALGNERHAKQRYLGDDQPRSLLRVRQTPHHFEEIDHRGEHQRAREHGQDGREEAPPEILRQRAADHDVCPIAAPARWAMRSVIAVIALVTKAGGSMMTPREIAKYPSTKVAIRPRYGSSSAIGVFTPAIMPTNPNPRSADVAPIAPASDMPRDCPVVRGAPR